MPPWLRHQLAAADEDRNLHVLITNRRNKTFTTADAICGVVTVPTNLLDDPASLVLEVHFVGTVGVTLEGYVPSIAAAGRKRQVCRVFVRIPQRTCLSEENVKAPSGRFEIPFSFVVPGTLPSGTCAHRVLDYAVRAAHERLPPSMGDAELSRQVGVACDCVPKGVSVRYGVFAKLVDQSRGDGEGVVVAVRAERVRVVPWSSGNSPAGVLRPRACAMRQEHRVLTSKLKRKTGALAMEAAQPTALCLSHVRSQHQDRPSTSMTLSLRFDPAKPNDRPPRLADLIVTLNVLTFFGTRAHEEFPSQATFHDTSGSEVHIHRRALSRRSVSGVVWTAHAPDEAATERSEDADFAAGNHPHGGRPAQSHTGGTYYTTEILVPVALPASETFVPTFHSCLVSLAYSLGIRLHLADRGVLGGGKVDLEVPVQVSHPGPRDVGATVGCYSSVALESGGCEGQVNGMEEPLPPYARERWSGDMCGGAQEQFVLPPYGPL